MAQAQKDKEHSVPEEETDKATERKHTDMTEEELIAMLNNLKEEKFNLLPKRTLVKAKARGMPIFGTKQPVEDEET